MDYIYSELDPAALTLFNNPFHERFYYGSSKCKCLGDSIIDTLSHTSLTAQGLKEGVTVTITTSEQGDLEIAAYPAKYGPLKFIDQNYSGINTLGAWEYTSLIYHGVEYLLYTTKLDVYSDDSVFVFKFN